MITDNGYSYGYVEHPSTIRRLADFPLDESSCFKTYQEAKDYAENNPIAYNTQIIGIKETGEQYQILNKKLVPLQTSEVNELKGCFGYWSITQLIAGASGSFDMNIVYPILADTYKIFIDEKDISGSINIGEGFVTAPVLFEDKINMQVKLYKDNNEILVLNIIPTFKNDKISCGILTTYTNSIK